MKSAIKLKFIGTIICYSLIGLLHCSAQKTQNQILNKNLLNDSLFDLLIVFYKEPSKSELRVAQSSILNYFYQNGYTDTSSIKINWFENMSSALIFEVKGSCNCEHKASKVPIHIVPPKIFPDDLEKNINVIFSNSFKSYEY